MPAGARWSHLQASAKQPTIAGRTMRSKVGGGLRPDAALYCLDGLKKFHELGDPKTRAIVFEIAMLSQSGLDINDPAQKYSLRSLPGNFSGLHLVSLMYTGMKRIDPTADAGIDLVQEFAEAKNLFEQSNFLGEDDLALGHTGR